MTTTEGNVLTTTGVKVARGGVALVTGAKGLLGTDLCAVFAKAYEVVATDRDECDVLDPEAVRRWIRETDASIVVHCAAYTAVDKAESDEDAAFRLNAEATRVVASACCDAGARFVTFGTDYVFDGTKESPYFEDDATNPLSAYGRSKLAAERAVADAGPSALLVRTQWLYGANGKNFIATIADRARNGQPLRVVDDQVGCPTWSMDLAEATLELVTVGASGIFHVSAGGSTTWHELAERVVGAVVPGYGPIPKTTTADLTLPAHRPLRSVLSKGKIESVIGRPMRHWAEAVDEFVAKHILRKEGEGR